MPASAKTKAVTAPLFPLTAEHVLRGYLAPKLAGDAALDLKPIIRTFGTPVKGKPFKIDAAAVKVAMDAALAPGSDGKSKLAKDADVADVQEVLSQLEELAPEIADLVVGGVAEVAPVPGAEPGAVPGAEPPAEPGAEPGAGLKPKGNPDAGIVDPKDRAEHDDLQDKAKSESDAPPADPTAADPAEVDDPPDESSPVEKVLVYLQDILSPEQMAEVQALVESEMATDTKAAVTKTDPSSAKDDKSTAVTHVAMDAAIKTAVTKATTETETRVVERFRAVEEAKQAVMPYVGPIRSAMDSAESVYRFALGKLGHDVKGVGAEALPHILRAYKVPGAPAPADPKLAADATAANDSMTKLFGVNANRLKSA